ncbi:hypothetical protein FTX61_08210 [Nitriliruptoraceae bacterium ZYF776]|nr:hypothetical protein [Profundirhabdus halotolerans]
MDRAYPDLWAALLEHDDCPVNLFGEVYVALSDRLIEPQTHFVRDEDGTVRDESRSIAARRDMANSDPREAESLVAAIGPDDFESEGAALRAMRDVHEALADAAGDAFAILHLSAMRDFVARYNLRYYIDDQAQFWMTFPGIAAVIFRQLRVAAQSHPQMAQELSAFEQALAECLVDPVDMRIKTAIQKQVNVLEAFGTHHPNVTGRTLGKMLEEVGSWPHNSMPEVGKGLYKFACDYPGIRHAGTFDAALRPLDLRDLIGVALSLVGLTPYFADGFEKTVAEAMFVAPPDSTPPGLAPWARGIDVGT